MGLWKNVIDDLDYFLNADEKSGLNKIASTIGGQVTDANTDPNSGNIPTLGEGDIDQSALVDSVDEDEPNPEQNVAVTGKNVNDYRVTNSNASISTTPSTTIQDESIINGKTKAARLAQSVLDKIKKGYNPQVNQVDLLKKAIEEALEEKAEDVADEAEVVADDADDVDEMIGDEADAEEAGEKAAQLFLQEIQKSAYFNKVQAMEFELSKQAGAQLAEKQIGKLVMQKKARDNEISKRAGELRAQKVLSKLLKQAGKKKR